MRAFSHWQLLREARIQEIKWFTTKRDFEEEKFTLMKAAASQQVILLVTSQSSMNTTRTMSIFQSLNLG